MKKLQLLKSNQELINELINLNTKSLGFKSIKTLLNYSGVMMAKHSTAITASLTLVTTTITTTIVAKTTIFATVTTTFLSMLLTTLF